jgi:hypothetical protein
MSPVVKWLLIGCGALLVICVIGIAAVALWVNAHKAELIAKGKAAESEGMQFGKGVPEPRCVDEALSRYSKDMSLPGTIRSSIWLDGCLKSSTFTDGFCDGVPSDDEILRSVSWRTEECRKRGFVGGQCGNVLAAMQKYCHGDARKKKKT